MRHRKLDAPYRLEALAPCFPWCSWCSRGSTLISRRSPRPGSPGRPEPNHANSLRRISIMRRQPSPHFAASTTYRASLGKCSRTAWPRAVVSSFVRGLPLMSSCVAAVRAEIVSGKLVLLDLVVPPRVPAHGGPDGLFSFNPDRLGLQQGRVGRMAQPENRHEREKTDGWSFHGSQLPRWFPIKLTEGHNRVFAIVP